MSDDPLLQPAVRAPRELTTWAEARNLVRQNSTDERSVAGAVERAQGRWRQSLGATTSRTPMQAASPLRNHW